MRMYLSVGVALAVMVLLGLYGGAGLGADAEVIRYFVDWRAAYPRWTGVLIIFTQAGGFTLLLGLCLAGGLWLAARGMWRTAASFVVTVLAGRLIIEFAKVAVGRPRPSFDAHPVTVFSQSFPSAHAGNSAITFLALALFVVPERWRRQALVGAAAMAIAVGATRPMLGVHWPSDVVGGWLFGAAWVSLCWHHRWIERSAA